MQECKFSNTHLRRCIAHKTCKPIDEAAEANDGCWNQHHCVKPKPGKVKAYFLAKIFSVENIQNVINY